MDIKQELYAGRNVVALTGRLDVNSAPDLERVGLDVVVSGKYNIVMDLSDVHYISSAGLRSILVVGKKAKASGGSLVLCGLKGMVQEVFEMSGFDSFFNTYEKLCDVPAL